MLRGIHLLFVLFLIVPNTGRKAENTWCQFPGISKLSEKDDDSHAAGGRYRKKKLA